MIISSVVGNDFVLPSIFDVLKSISEIATDSESYQIVMTSVVRTVLAVGISFFTALILATVAYFNEKFEEFFHIFYIILKTVPTISIMIICLLWFGREGSVTVIVSLIVFPIIYSGILFSYKNIDKSLILNTSTYENEFFIKLKRVYLPLIRNGMLEALRNTLSLGFKVTVMAEVLSQISKGIGKELYFAKINLNMTDIFAWTLIMIAVSVIFDGIVNYFIRRFRYE